MSWAHLEKNKIILKHLQHFCPALLNSNFIQFEQQDVGEDTVSKEREDDEVDRGEHATANASLRLDPVVHDRIPVLAGQDLRETEVSGWECRHKTRAVKIAWVQN